MCIVGKEVYSWGGTLHNKTGKKNVEPSIIPSLSKLNIIYIDCG